MYSKVIDTKLSVDCGSFAATLPLTNPAIDAANRGDMLPALKEGLDAARQWLFAPSTSKVDAKRLSAASRHIASDLMELDGPVSSELAAMSDDELLAELTN